MSSYDKEGPTMEDMVLRVSILQKYVEDTCKHSKFLIARIEQLEKDMEKLKVQFCMSS